MAHSRAGSRDSSEPDVNFRGFARVRLSALKFTDALLAEHRRESDQNVERLVRIFRTEGCKRDNEKHFVTGLVKDEQLDGVVSSRDGSLCSIPPRAWEDVPLLGIDSIECHNGLHRICAAKEHLKGGDRWWVVRVCTKGDSSTTDLVPGWPPVRPAKLIEEYENEQAYCDGTIFRKIRLYHRQSNQEEEMKWWARLSKTKQNDLRQLLRDERYVKAFDALLPFSGLWETIRLGSLHRLLTMKCDEELLRKLNYLAQYWKATFAGVEHELHRDVVDHESVHLLETLAPGLSLRDADRVRELVLSKRVFPAITVDRTRSSILENLLNTPGLIPSLFTFFEDLKQLEPCAKIMRGLLPPKQKRSIFEALSACYTIPDELHVEHSYCDRRIEVAAPREHRLTLGYQQLWLYAWRNFASMTDVAPRKDQLKPKPETSAPSPLAWQDFGRLAVLLGFNTSVAACFAAVDAEAELAKETLERGDIYSATDQDIERVANVLRSAGRKRKLPGAAEFYSDCDVPRERRCGRPYEADHDNDRDALFLPVMYTHPVGRGQDITTFYCKWDMFRTFFDCAIPEMSFTGLQPEGASSPQPMPAELSCSRCDAQRSAASVAHNRCAELQTSVSGLTEQNQRLQRDIDISDGERRMLAATNASLKATVEATSDRLAYEQQLKDENESLRAQLRGLESKSAASDRQMEELTAAKRSLEAAAEATAAGVIHQKDLDAKQRQRELSDLQEQIVTLTSGVSGMEGEKKRLDDLLMNAQSEMAERDRQIRSLVDDQEQVKSKQHELVDRIERVGAQHASELSTCQDTIAGLKEQAERLKHELSQEQSRHSEEKDGALRQHQEILSDQLSKQRQEACEKHSAVISAHQASHQRETEMQRANYQREMETQRANHQQEIDDVQLALSKRQVAQENDRQIHVNLRAQYDRLQSAYKQQAQHYGLGKPPAPIGKDYTFRRIRMEGDTFKEKYFHPKVDQLKEWLTCNAFDDQEICIGEDMKVVGAGDRSIECLVKAWRKGKVLSYVPKEDFDSIRRHAQFTDFSGRDNLVTDLSARPFERITEVGDDLEDEDAAMSDSTEDEQDGTEERLSGAISKVSANMDMTEAASRSAMVRRPKQIYDRVSAVAPSSALVLRRQRHIQQRQSKDADRRRRTPYEKTRKSVKESRTVDGIEVESRTVDGIETESRTFDGTEMDIDHL